MMAKHSLLRKEDWTELDKGDDIPRYVTIVGRYGCTIYGPYVSFPPGRYCAGFRISLAEAAPSDDVDCCGFIDVVAENGHRTLALLNLFSHRIADSDITWLPFDLAEETIIETRVHTNGARRLSVASEIEIRKADEVADVCMFAQSNDSIQNDVFRWNKSQLWHLFHQGADVSISGDKIVGEYNGTRIPLSSSEEIGMMEDIFCFNDYHFANDRNFVFIDIGMNVGMASLYMAGMPNAAKIHAFEPFSGPFDRALANLEFNPHLAPKISANMFGLGNGDRELEVFTDDDNTIAVSVRGVESGRQTRIQIRDAGSVIAPIIADATASGLDVFVKIDCEGSEFDIFDSLDRQGLLGQIRGVLVEWHKWWDPSKTQQDLISRLLDNKYVVFDRTRPSDPWAGRFNAVRVG